MKRLFLLLICIYSLSVFSYERKFDPKHYKIEPSSINTVESVTAISSFNDQLFFLRDGRVYAGTVDNNKYEVNKCDERRDMTALHIDGQFCQFGNNTIYYSSEGVLYKASMKNGEWTNPEELKISGYETERVMEEGSSFATKRWGFKPKTKAKERMYNPAIAKNGKRIYFSSSELPGGKGGSDIWYIDRNSDNVSWSAPVNYEEVNSGDDEDFPRFFSDTLFYFSSNRADKFNGYNIYKKRLRGDKSISLASNSFNSNSDDKNFVVVSSSPFFLSNRAGVMKIFRPKFYDPDLDSIDIVVKNPGLQIRPQSLVVKDKVYTFYAEFDNKRLAAGYENEFFMIYQFIQNNPNNRFEIVGYCDEEGSADHNVSVSLFRANVIMDKLVEMGVNEDQLSYRGEGNSKPVIINAKTDDERRMNRRIEIIKK